jgi:hypothetical protein
MTKEAIRLPPEIYTAAPDACKSAYLPLQAQAEARNVLYQMP